MKQHDDHYTAELPGLPAPRRKPGPKPIGLRPMTNAERQRRFRAKRRFVTHNETRRVDAAALRASASGAAASNDDRYEA